MRTYYESEAEAIDVAVARYGANWVAHYFLHAFDLPNGDRGWVILRRVEKTARVAHKKGKVRRGPGQRVQSKIDRPVERARAIFDLLRGKSRAEVVAQCVAQGIAEGTANTQYSKWVKANSSTNGANVS